MEEDECVKSPDNLQYSEKLKDLHNIHHGMTREATAVIAIKPLIDLGQE